MARNLQAVLIDPFARTLTDVVVENELFAFHTVLKCDCVCQAVLSNSKPRADVWCDDEGLLKPNEFFVVTDLHACAQASVPVAAGFFAGRAFVLGPARAGDATDTPYTARAFTPQVRWVIPGRQELALRFARLLASMVRVFEDPKQLDAHRRDYHWLLQSALAFTEPAT